MRQKLNVASTNIATTSAADLFYFTPRRAFWEMNREQVLLLGGGRVLLMQIAHPMIAEAVYNHSYVFQKPILRLHRTLSLTFAIVYATKPEADAAVAEIERAHRPAVGKLADAIGKHEAGAAYNPRNPRQALWVWATLVEGAVAMYERLVAPVESGVKEEFYADSTTFAHLLGIRENYLPNSYVALVNYMDEAIAAQEVHVSEKARAIAPFITAQSIPVVNVLTYPLSRFTVGLLPEAIREQYGYNFRGWESRLLNGFCATSRATVSWLPGLVRYVAPYRRAMAILKAGAEC
jgi:uncharacterized protein (DUF2236 family)